MTLIAEKTSHQQPPDSLGLHPLFWSLIKITFPPLPPILNFLSSNKSNKGPSTNWTACGWSNLVIASCSSSRHAAFGISWPSLSLVGSSPYMCHSICTSRLLWALWVLFRHYHLICSLNVSSLYNWFWTWIAKVSRPCRLFCKITFYLLRPISSVPFSIFGRFVSKAP